MRKQGLGRRAAVAPIAALALGAFLHCRGAPTSNPQESSAELDLQPVASRVALSERAAAIFGALPAEASSAINPVTPEKVALGRMLYYEPRLSRNHDVSCNSCHALDGFGVDGERTSPGHRGQRGDRNSPTVYNAALHIRQFWDGRAADVEEQAKGPILNPVEMAMPSEAFVIEVLRSIPGYAQPFEAAFPGAAHPIAYDNLARAIGAFERRLLTPSRFDDFMSGQLDALSSAEVAGLERFIEVGCITCHNGPTVGGGLFQKLGAQKRYRTKDPGREGVTGNESDRGVFKVPSLRNVARTGPYLHDGSIGSLEEMVRIMGEYQLGQKLGRNDVRAIAAFLESLTGRVDAAYIAHPELPESGPDTPLPDPS